MRTPIDFLEAKRNKEIRKLHKKKGYSKELERQGTFVARFSYPIEIGDIINFIERMGIINEEKILPELYKIQKQIEIDYEN
jgi:hypothetical protein